MRYLFLATAILALAITIFFKLCRKTQSVPSNKKTVIAVTSKLIDIGNHQRFSSIKGRYTIINKGSNDLYIQNVHPDCHCTVGEYSRQAVKPNDSSIIYLRYDSTILGYFQSSALVTSNSDQTPLLLVLRGKVVDSTIHQ